MTLERISASSYSYFSLGYDCYSILSYEDWLIWWNMKSKKKNRSAFSITSRYASRNKENGFEVWEYKVFGFCIGDWNVWWWFVVRTARHFLLQTWFLALPFACEAMSSENLFNLSCLFTLDSYLLLLLFLFRYYKDTSS